MSTQLTPIDEENLLKGMDILPLLEIVSVPELDNLTQLASDICDAPVSLISLVKEERDWFKSSEGLEAPKSLKTQSFCSYVTQGVVPMIVEDASADPRFQNNEFVLAPQGIRFYVGIPLVSPSGVAVGTLCVIDYKVRTLSDRQLNNLQRLAGQVVALLEARRTHFRLPVIDQARLVSDQRLDFAPQAADIGDWDMDLRTNVARRSLKHDQCFGYAQAVPEWGYDTFLAHIVEADRARVNDCCQKAMAGEGTYDVEFRVVWPDQTVHWLWSKGRFYFDEGEKPYRVAGIQVDITERKKIEENLRESEYRLRFAIQGSGDGLWDWDLQSNRIFYSERWKTMLGLENDDIGSDPMLFVSHLHPDDKSRVLGEVQSHLDGHSGQYVSEHRILCKDGRLKWMLGRGIVVQRDASGKPLRMTGTHTDITERKEMECALQASNTQLKLLETCVSRLNDIVLITEAEPFDQPGPRIVFVNDAFVRRTGYSRQEVIGETPRILQGPKTQREELDRIRAALKRWEPVRAELINYTKAGQEFWLELDIVPVANASGWYTHWVSVERDITQRKWGEAALRESEKRHRSMFENNPQPMWVYDVETLAFLSVNDAMVAQYGYSREELLQMTLRDIRVAEKLGKLDASLAVDLQLPFTPVQMWTHLRKDGSKIQVELSAHALDFQGSSARLVIAHDITRLKVNEEALQTLVHEKSALLKEVHHRVKNNLQVITSLLRLQGRRSQTDDTKTVLVDMQARIRSMALLYESLNRSGTFASVDLGHYLRQLSTQAFQTQSTNSGAAQLQLNLGSVQVCMDQAVPCGLLVNELISNCLKHAFPDGMKGDVVVDLQQLDNAQQWCLRVSDTGVGLPPDFQHKRQNSLGLQLVADLARQLKGELTIMPNQNRGTAFAVNFQVLESASLVMPV